MRASRLALLAVLLLPAPLAVAGSGEVWLISTRCAPVCGDSRGRSRGDSALAIGRRRLLAAGNHSGVPPQRHGGRANHNLHPRPPHRRRHGRRARLASLPAHARGRPRQAVPPGDLVVARRSRRPPTPRGRPGEGRNQRRASVLSRPVAWRHAAEVPVCLVGYSFRRGTATGRWSCWPAGRSPARPCRRPTPCGGLIAWSSWPPPPTPTLSCPAIATAAPWRWSNACWRRRIATTGR